MRALTCHEYGPPESLVIEEYNEPIAGEGQLVVDVVAAGINFPDVLTIAGKYQVKIPTPFIPGVESAGVVSAVGPGVKRFSVGDRVMATANTGAFGEKCVVSAQTTMPLPEGLDFEQAAGFAITYGTSYHAFRQSAALKADETVLVLGAAGGVGTSAVEIAKAMGAKVIAAASSDEKLAFARSVGADETINYSNHSLNDAVKDLTDKRGVDVVYDPVGGELANQALRATAWHGRYLVIGFACGDIPSFPANIALLKEASIIGVWWGTWAAKNPALQVKNMQEMAALIKSGELKPRAPESYPLDDYANAFQSITERRARGKVVLLMR